MELIANYRYPIADTYSGKAEKCTFALLTTTSFADEWLCQMIAAQIQDQAMEQGGHMLTLRVWRDVEIYESEPGVFVAVARLTIEAISSASPLAWAIIIPALITLLEIAIIAWALVSVVNMIWNPSSPMTWAIAIGVIVFAGGYVLSKVRKWRAT